MLQNKQYVCMHKVRLFYKLQYLYSLSNFSHWNLKCSFPKDIIALTARLLEKLCILAATCLFFFVSYMSNISIQATVTYLYLPIVTIPAIFIAIIITVEPLLSRWSGTYYCPYLRNVHN